MDQPRIVLSQSAPIAQYFPEADHTSSSPGIAYNDAEAFFFFWTLSCDQIIYRTEKFLLRGIARDAHWKIEKYIYF